MAITLSGTTLGACTTVASSVPLMSTSRCDRVRDPHPHPSIHREPEEHFQQVFSSQGDRRWDLNHSCVFECLWTVNTGKAENLCFNLFILLNSINRNDCCSTGGPGIYDD